MIHFVIPYDPVAKGRPRVAKWGGVFTPKKTRDAQKQIADYVSMNAPEEILKGPIRLVAMYYIKRPKCHAGETYCMTRPDIDNYNKLLMDAITDSAGVWEDDSRVVQSIGTKLYGDVPRIEVFISEMG